MVLSRSSRRVLALLALFSCVLLSSFTPSVHADPAPPNQVRRATPGSNSAIISNGTIQLGVKDEGHLNVEGGTLSSGSDGTTVVGLRYMPTNGEATAPGCLCEGWGVADATSGLTGYANIDSDGGVRNLRLLSFTSTISQATSIVMLPDSAGDNKISVIHRFHPSPLTPFLYQADVTIRNLSDADMDLRYRRVMDWDIQPNTFNEHVTIQGTATSPAVLFASNDGFATANPLGDRSDLGSTGDFVDAGPDDHGALFDFGFGIVRPGQAKFFTIYYGAAGNEADAIQALADVRAEVYSLGQPDVDPAGGTPNTFIFGFSGISQDSDGDGLFDDWERNGVYIDPDLEGPLSAQLINLPAMGADPNKPDIFLHIDWMENGAHSHKLDPTAIRRVVESFANSPYTSPTGSVGINLHVDQGSDSILNFATNATWGTLSKARALTHVDNLGTMVGNAYDWADFDQIKNEAGGFTETGRTPIFHYVISAHNYGDTTSSGLSRGIEASDLIVSLGSFPGGTGTVDHQAGTLMHELGHNLGLRHGGGDDVNNKPNYLSIMNYSFQLDGLRQGGAAGVYDYSRADLDTLDEQNLDENAGLSAGAAGYDTLYYCASSFSYQVATNADGPIDWNCDGDTTDTALTSDITGDDHCLESGTNGVLDTAPSAGDDQILGISSTTTFTPTEVRDGPNRTCETAATGDDQQIKAVGSAQPNNLDGFDDWTNIKFKVGAIGLAGIRPGFLPRFTEGDFLTPELAELLKPADTNAPPSVNAGPDATIPEGGSLSSSGSFSDPRSTSWTATVDYGDGSGTQPLALTGTTFALEHTYADNGTYSVTVSVTDEKGAVGSDTLIVNVQNVAPSLGPLQIGGGNATACITGNDVSLGFSFTDPAGSNDSYTGSIDWGDGSPVTAFQHSPVSATHHYAAGTYTIRVRVSDEDGGSDQQIAAVNLLYTMSPILPPVSGDGSSIFQYGRTVPVKVRIVDCKNTPVAGLKPAIGWSTQGGLAPGDPINPASSTSGADSGSTMRYDATEGVYIYNFATRPTLPAANGTYFFYVRENLAKPSQVSQRFSVRAR